MNDFLCKLQEINKPYQTLPSDTLLVTWDVKSLYTNIPHANGIKACEHFPRHNNYNNNKVDTILNFIELVLTCNNLTFQGNHYVQQTGTAMGTKMAPTYANLYMGHLEQQLLEHTTRKPLVWFRFIDDIFHFFHPDIWQTEVKPTTLTLTSSSNRQCQPILFHSWM